MSVLVEVAKFKSTCGRREITTQVKYSRVPCIGEVVMFNGTRCKVDWVAHLPEEQYKPSATIHIIE